MKKSPNIFLTLIRIVAVHWINVFLNYLYYNPVKKLDVSHIYISDLEQDLFSDYLETTF